MSLGILIDSCMFIDHLRTKNKENSSLAKVLRVDTGFFISTVVEYEVELGITPAHREQWNSLFEDITVVPFDSSMALLACEIKHQLKSEGKQIELADLFIAATAVAKGLSLATRNHKHFGQIDGLTLFVPEEQP